MIVKRVRERALAGDCSDKGADVSVCVCVHPGSSLREMVRTCRLLEFSEAGDQPLWKWKLKHQLIVGTTHFKL